MTTRISWVPSARAALTLIGFLVGSNACTPARAVAPVPPGGGPAAKFAPLAPVPFLEGPRERAEKAGAGRFALLAEGSGIPGDSVEGLVDVPAGRCALLYARGGADIQDLDLIAYGEDGTELGADEAEDSHPTLLLCPEAEQRIFVAARVVQGRGRLALGVHDVAPARREKVARAVEARGEEKASPEAWPGLESTLAGHRRKIGGSWVDLRRVAIPVDARVPTRISAEIPAERCLDALLVPSNDVARLDLEALDHEGRIIARAPSRNAARSLVLCGGGEKTPVSLEVRPESGRGLALVVLSTSRTPRAGLDLRPGVQTVETAPRASTVEPVPPEIETGRAAEGRGTIEKSVTLRLEGEKVQSVPVDASGCSRIDLVPLDSLLGFEARLWNAEGLLVGETSSSVSAPLFFCSTEAGLRLDVSASRRGGGLRVDVRKTETRDSPYLALPLAASRLLSELHRSAALPSLVDAPAPRALDLAPDRLARTELEVSAGRCATVFVALDRGAWGIELRLVDAETGFDLGSTRGARSTHLQACPTGSRKLRVAVEVRSVDGRAKALLAAPQTSRL